jgi:hypothetical protein
MGAAQQAADYRFKADECVSEADAIDDAREAKLYRAFADQFRRRAQRLDEPAGRRAS